MSVKSILLFLFFIFAVAAQNASAQNLDSTNISRAVQKIINNSTFVAKIKDSTAIYSYAITIHVQRQKNKQIVNTAINNPEILVFFEGLEKLKEVNYLPLLGKRKKMTFFFSSYILVYGSENYEYKVKLSDIPKALRHLFLPNQNNMYDLGATLLEVDKRAYD